MQLLKVVNIVGLDLKILNGKKVSKSKKSISQKRKENSDKNKNGIAKGCGMVMEDRRKKTKRG